MRIVMDSLSNFSIFLWIVLSNTVTGIRYPHELSVSGEDFKFTFTWKISEFPLNAGTVNKTWNLTDEKTSEPQQTVETGTFTVFQWGLMTIGDDDNYTEQEVWTRTKGCDRVSGNECQLEELFDYFDKKSFWVADTNVDTTVKIKDVDPSQTLDYGPEGQMTFSPPNISISRKQNTLFIKFHPKTLEIWGLNETIPEYLQNNIYEPIYLIYYYEDLKENNFSMENQESSTDMPDHKTIPAYVSNVTIPTSIPTSARICVSIRFVDDEITEGFKTSFSKKCLPPETATVGRSEHVLLSSGTAMTFLYVIFAATSVVFVIIVVQCCRRKGPRTLKKVFSIHDIEIPKTTNDILKEDPKLNSRLIFNGVPDDTEIVDIIDPSHHEDDVFHISSCLHSGAKSKHDRIPFDCAHTPMRERQRYETDTRNMEQQNSHGSNQSSLHSAPDLHGSSSNEAMEDYLDMSSSPNVIVFEHLPGPYIAGCLWNANEGALPITSSVRSKDQEVDQAESTEDSKDLCLANKAFRKENRAKLPKQRFLSEDSAFYDDFPLATSSEKTNECNAAYEEMHCDAKS